MELSLTDGYRLFEALSVIDSAAGWNLQISQAATLFLPYFTDEAVEEASADPSAVFAGAFFPPGEAIPTGSGFRYTNRTPFASGCHQATWFFQPTLIVEDGRPRSDPATGQPIPHVVMFPAADAEIIDTWDTFGMRGTGSHDVAATDIYIPEHRVAVMAPTESRPAAFSAPMYGTAPFPGIHAETCVSLGVSRAAIDFVTDLAGAKTPFYSETTLRDRQVVQAQVARAEALLNASRAYLHQSARDAVARVESSGGFPIDSRIDMQLAACFAAESCAEAVDLVWAAAGSTSIKLDAPLERHFRDVHTLTQHTSKSLSRYESSGRVMLGLEPDHLVFLL